MKILLTGATGFLGSHLVRALIGAGAEVLILKRSFSNTARIDDLLPSLVVYDSDCCDLPSLFRNHENIDMILHAATCYGRNGESFAEIAEANITFPLRLLDLAAGAGVSTFLNMDTGLDRFLNSYALSKKNFSDWGRLTAQLGRISFVNVVLEHFFGPGDDASKFVTYVIRNCISNVPQLNLTKGEQLRDFIYIDDVVAACLLTLQNSHSVPPAFIECGLGSGVGVRVRTLVERVHMLTGSSSFLNFGALPYRPNEVMESVADTRFLHDLGWSPQVSLAEGLARTITYEQRSVAER